ncbi:MAG TPA: hypothetical protein DEB15_13250, partial [Pusillimonas sp.]|nr:hypothetical protein [Pusillimonas sp.]
GQLETDTSASIGLQAGSIGTVIVDGPTSQWGSSSPSFNLTVGESGTGTLAVSNGGKVSNTTSPLPTSVGKNSGSIGLITIDGVGSSLTHTLAGMIIGDFGTGTLEIRNGGLAENTFALVGRAAGGSGSVTVTGSGSAWNNGTGLRIGDFGTGTLSIENDGVVSVGSGTGSLSLGRAGGNGTLNIGNGATAGVLNATSVSGGTGTATINFNHTDTNYHFTDNGTATGNAIVISGSTSVNFIGSGTTTLTGNHTYTGNTTVNNGTLRLADNNRISDAGNMVINGGTFDLNNFNETVANLYGTGGVINLGNSGNSTLTVNQTVNSTYGGSFIGNANSFSHNPLIKNGPGTLTLGGTSLQTGSAQITVNAGRLAVAGGNAIADTYGLTGAGEFELLNDETISNLSMGSTGKVLLNDNTLTIRTVPAMVGNNNAAISGTGSIVISGDGG